MTTPPVLETPSGRGLPGLDLQAHHLLDCAIVLYGASNSGKTVVVKRIMELLRPHIEQVLVVSPTENANHTYAAFVPKQLIHDRPWLPEPGDAGRQGAARGRRAVRDDTVDGVARFLDTIWLRQEGAVTLYERSSNPAVLLRLFERLPAESQREARRLLTELDEHRDRTLAKLRARPADADTDKRADDVRARCTELRTTILKHFLVPFQGALWRSSGLAADEREALQYLQLNPRLLLVFDDCAADLRQFRSSPAFTRYFYQGRHARVTTVFCCQDDGDLPPNLRKQAFLSIFTTAEVARTNFTRVASGGGSHMRSFIEDVLPVVYKDRFRKLVYWRSDPSGQRFYHLTVVQPRPFSAVGPALRELCEQVAVDDFAVNADNPFFGRFAAAVQSAPLQ